MDVHDPYADFFLSPGTPIHRRYELLRARFVEKLSLQHVAQRFGLKPSTVQSQVRHYKKALDGGQAP